MLPLALGHRSLYLIFAAEVALYFLSRLTFPSLLAVAMLVLLPGSSSSSNLTIASNERFAVAAHAPHHTDTVTRPQHQIIPWVLFAPNRKARPWKNIRFLTVTSKRPYEKHSIAEMGQTNMGRQAGGPGRKGDTYFTSEWPPTKHTNSFAHVFCPPPDLPGPLLTPPNWFSDVTKIRPTRQQ